MSVPLHKINYNKLPSRSIIETWLSKYKIQDLRKIHKDGNYHLNK